MPVTRNQSAANAKPSTDANEANSSKETADKAETSTEGEPPRRDSPDNCSICLGPFNNKSFTSSCAHSFCFVCLKQWSKVKAECPLCKQPFTSIFHNIRSNDSYDIYELPPHNPPRPMDYNFYDYVGRDLTSFAAPTHHYFSLSRPSLDADLTLSNFSRFQFRHRRYDRFLNPLHPVQREHQYSYPSSSVNPSTHVSAAYWPRGSSDFRHRVYRDHMGPPDLILGAENSTYRLTPAMVAASAHRMHRIMPWLTRELRVLLRSHQNVRLAIGVIQPLLTQVTIDSIYFSERVSPLIGRRARQFIQEFVAFANSALSMQAFDRKAMYRRVPSSSTVLYDDDSSSSSADTDVVEVTDISPETQTEATSSVNASGLGRSGWDSPIPGPSWESMGASASAQVEDDRVTVSSESDDPVFRPDLNESDSDNSRAGSDIVFVKYDKPWNERSPIQLSSDSDGEGRSRKRKRSKHKKKKREGLDSMSGSGKKGKGHKSAKSKGREKSKAKSKTGSGDDLQQESEPSPSHKRPHSATSSDRQKRKKHKRSKERSEEGVSNDKDRELVDRLFAEAMSQQNVNFASAGGDVDIPCSSKSKDSHRKSGKSSEKDKHRKKKKKKNTSKGSRSPLPPSYKKHHSGHKKSSDPSNKGHDSEKRRHRRRHASRENAASEHSSHAGSFERELQAPRNQTLPPPNLGPSMTSTYQPPYLSMPPDTVQHIPLNLWVSTWPSLPVSHTFPTPPSSSFPPPSMAHQSSSSGLPVLEINHSLSEANTSAIDSHTISSDSSSSSESSDSNDEVVTSSVPKGSRTKQWVEANFPDGGQPTSTGFPALAITSTSTTIRNWGTDTLLPKDPPQIAGTSAEDVVSIESDDEDVVVCSSASSTKSDSDEVKVIEDSDVALEFSTPFCTAPSTSDIRNNDPVVVTSPDNPSARTEDGTLPHGSTAPLPSPPTCVSFQPFKLQRKLTFPKQTINPLFSAMAHSSDDDGADEVDVCEKTEAAQQGIANVTKESSSEVIDHVIGSNSAAVSSVHVTSVNWKNSTTQPAGYVSQAFVTSAPSVGTDIHQDSQTQSERTSISASSTSFSTSSAESIFGLLPPLQAVSAPVTSMMSTSLNYLPYPSISVSSSLSSILPQSLPFVVPRPPAPPPLPLHFPFPPLPPLIPSAPPLFPSVYSPYSHGSQVPPTATSSPLISSRDPKFSDALVPAGECSGENNVKTHSDSDVVVDDDEEDRSEQKKQKNMSTDIAPPRNDSPSLTSTSVIRPDNDVHQSGAISSSSQSIMTSSGSVNSVIIGSTCMQGLGASTEQVTSAEQDVTEELNSVAAESICSNSDLKNDNQQAVGVIQEAEDTSNYGNFAAGSSTQSAEPFFDALDPSSSVSPFSSEVADINSTLMEQSSNGQDIGGNTGKDNSNILDISVDMLPIAENHTSSQSPVA